MSRNVTLLAVLVLLTACSGKAPAPVPSGSAHEAEAPALPVMGPEQRVLAMGDSLFAGYGLNSGESYPARLEAALRAAGRNVRVTNAGVSGDTSAAAAQRFGFVLDSQPAKPDLVILELGGNDELRGLPPAETRKNLEAILVETRTRGLKVLVMGMLAPPNLGSAYKAGFEPIYPELARKYGAALVPWFLAGVINRPELMQPDHHHPNAEGVLNVVKATLPAVEKALPPARP